VKFGHTCTCKRYLWTKFERTWCRCSSWPKITISLVFGRLCNHLYHRITPHISTQNRLSPSVSLFVSNAVVTCEIKLIQNYFSLRQCPTETILFQHMETCLKLFIVPFALGAHSFSITSPKIWNSLVSSSVLLQMSRYFPLAPQDSLLPASLYTP